jgi:uncharacterized protein (DUF608 family)
MANTNWPVLKQYDGEHLRRIALPLGGIGTGTVSLGGRGDLRDWEIVNRPAKGFAPANTFFALNIQGSDLEPITRVLEGPLDGSEYEGAFGSTARNHGLPRFRQARFAAAYPLGQVLLSDPDVPVAVRLQAFNPFIPADPERSGLPLASLRYELTNRSDKTLQVAICGNVQNFIGQDGSNGKPEKNRNQFCSHETLRGISGSSLGVAPEAEQWGTLALATTHDGEVSHRASWADLSWGDSLLDFWDDFHADGRLEERQSDVDAPMLSLCAQMQLAPGETKSITFLLAWHFPNRMTWSPTEEASSCCSESDCCPSGNPNLIGNYYTTRWSDAWDVLQSTFAQLEELESATVQFVQSFCDSDLPGVVKEAALFNLSTLRSQTCFRTPDGHFFGWEGCGDKGGCCEGSCTHVWNYEHATAFLFGSLARSMREVEFLHATRDNGHMSFRTWLPLARAAEHGIAAADGQMGCLMKLYREWQLSGDDAWLEVLWPRAKRALEFCWIDGGWDADRDGVMEGCQHNTMDVEYFGPNPQMQGWYLGALRAAEAMARHLSEVEFASQCHDLFEQGSRWMDEHLWNGDYYEHEIRPIPDASRIAPGLRHESMGAHNLQDPELQLGSGCLVDQLVGQYTAHVCGLGYLHDQTHVQSTLSSILRYNYRSSLWNHFNHLRTFALGEEAALLMASYPKGRRPARPFPYYNEVMTGFEYTAGVHMLYEGAVEDGLKVIQSIRDRYDGRKRNPFDEAECGHHYARAMASWAAVLALTGFHYSAVTQTLKVKAAEQPSKYFWSTGFAYGTLQQTPRDNMTEVNLAVLSGELALSHLELSGFGVATLDSITLRSGDQINTTIVRA